LALSTSVADFHCQACARAGRTTKKSPCQPGGFSSEVITDQTRHNELNLSNLKARGLSFKVGKNQRLRATIKEDRL